MTCERANRCARGAGIALAPQSALCGNGAAARANPVAAARGLRRAANQRGRRGLARARGGQSRAQARCGAPSTPGPAFETLGRHSPGRRRRAAPVRLLAAARGGGCRAPWAPGDAGMNRACPRAAPLGLAGSPCQSRSREAAPGAPPISPQSGGRCSQWEAAALSTPRSARSGAESAGAGLGLSGAGRGR